MHTHYQFQIICCHHFHYLQLLWLINVNILRWVLLAVAVLMSGNIHWSCDPFSWSVYNNIFTGSVLVRALWRPLKNESPKVSPCTLSCSLCIFSIFSITASSDHTGPSLPLTCWRSRGIQGRHVFTNQVLVVKLPPSFSPVPPSSPPLPPFPSPRPTPLLQFYYFSSSFAPADHTTASPMPHHTNITAQHPVTPHLSHITPRPSPFSMRTH